MLSKRARRERRQSWKRAHLEHHNVSQAWHRSSEAGFASRGLPFKALSMTTSYPHQCFPLSPLPPPLCILFCLHPSSSISLPAPSLPCTPSSRPPSSPPQGEKQQNTFPGPASLWPELPVVVTAYVAVAASARSAFACMLTPLHKLKAQSEQSTDSKQNPDHKTTFIAAKH